MDKNKRLAEGMGYYQWRGTRVTGHLQRVYSLVTMVGVFVAAHWDLMWLVWLLPLSFIFMWWLDKKYLYYGESQAAYKENPQWVKLMEKLEGIEKNIKESKKGND